MGSECFTRQEIKQGLHQDIGRELEGKKTRDVPLNYNSPIGQRRITTTEIIHRDYLNNCLPFFLSCPTFHVVNLSTQTHKHKGNKTSRLSKLSCQRGSKENLCSVCGPGTKGERSAPQGPLWKQQWRSDRGPEHKVNPGKKTRATQPAAFHISPNGAPCGKGQGCDSGPWHAGERELPPGFTHSVLAILASPEVTATKKKTEGGREGGKKNEGILPKRTFQGSSACCPQKPSILAQKQRQPSCLTSHLVS